MAKNHDLAIEYLNEHLEEHESGLDYFLELSSEEISSHINNAREIRRSIRALRMIGNDTYPKSKTSIKPIIIKKTILLSYLESAFKWCNNIKEQDELLALRKSIKNTHEPINIGYDY